MAGVDSGTSGGNARRSAAAAGVRAGVNDAGGTLMNESTSRAAGAEHGHQAQRPRAVTFDDKGNMKIG